ncbi:MAG: TonB-dependent receptor [Candidatus Eremiobacteraeota bacterium]|nr:TonB-dependent receptor [Candidatus Eremiobacteraeota bacterium]
MRARLFLATCLVALLAFAAPQPVRAQTAPSEIEVRVSDAAHKPLADARVFISGALTTSALTPRDGKLRFTDVEPGLYRLRIVLAGYAGVDVDDVEALAGRRKIVDVTLERALQKGAAAAATPAPGTPSDLKEIGRVQARPAVSQSSVDVDEGNPVRRISENLADALDKIAGISVSQDQQFGTLSISLRNADASRTQASAGGVPLVGGGAAALQSVAADLSSGVSVDNGNNFGGGGVGGAVNFRTLEPTRTWQAQTSASYGGYERTSLQFSLSGSYHKLGVAVQHGVRGGDSILTGLRFADTSGQTYVHDGAFDRYADFLKLRYPVGHLTLTAGYLAGANRSSPLCDQFVTALPCGYGPGGSIHSKTNLENFGAQGQIGNVIVSLQGSGSYYSAIDDELHRVVAGVPAPYRSDNSGTSIGYSASQTIAIHRHTLALYEWSYTGHGQNVVAGQFGGIAPYSFRSAGTVFADTLKLSDRWSVALGYGSNISAAQSRTAVDIAVTLTPSRAETITFGIGSYGNGSFTRSTGFFGDPAQSIFNCPADEVRVTGPADAPSAGSQTSTNFSYSRRGRRGTLSVRASDSTDRNGTFNAQFPLQALAPGTIPPGYVDQLAAYWHGGGICGGQAFDPSRIYVAEQIAGATLRYRSLDASGQIVLGRAVIALPSYSINGATLASGDPRLLFVGSTFAVGAQLPYRPLHKAGLLLDARQSRAGLEWVVNGTWTSGNNINSLGSYIQVAAGVTWTAQRGRVTLFANNLFNTDTGLFATREFVQPQALRGGGSYVPVPLLLPPRTYTLLYSLRAGRTK